MHRFEENKSHFTTHRCAEVSVEVTDDLRCKCYGAIQHFIWAEVAGWVYTGLHSASHYFCFIGYHIRQARCFN